MMILTEKHVISRNSDKFSVLDDLCFKAKNLYNATLYAIRQHYFQTKKFLSYPKVNKLFIQQQNADYYALPTKVSQQIQRLVNQNFNSFFGSLKKKRTGAVIRIPKYLDKTKGRQVLLYTSQAASFKNKNVPDGYLKLSGTDFLLKTKVENVQFVRIVPKGNCIVVEVGYQKEEKEKISGSDFASIDLGVSTLAALTFTNRAPLLINGKPLKSINQFYNKKMAELRSEQDKKGEKHRRTKRMQRLTLKRHHKIMDYLHKASHYIVNQLVSNHIPTLVIGYNKGWKQDTDMSKHNNQNFVQIPFHTFVNLLKYKCALEGIEIVLQEESYTSKCSFLDQETITRHTIYAGKRVKRGLFRTKQGLLLNADVNGSYNIMKKYLNEVRNMDAYALVNLIEVCSTPSVFTVNT